MVTRPQAGNSAATLDSINSLCDAADAVAGQIAALQQLVQTAQAAIAAEVQARGAAVTSEAQVRAAGVTGEAQARDSAITAEAQARATAVAGEAQARAAAIEQEQQDRQVAVNAAVQALAGQISSLHDVLQAAISAEAAVRTRDDSSEQQARTAAIRDLAQDLADAVSRLEGLISAKASEDDLTAAVAAQTKLLSDAVSKLSGLISGAQQAINAHRFEFLPDTDRPGNAPARFTLVTDAGSLSGSRGGLPEIPAEHLANDDSGPVVRLSGAGILAARNAFALEPGRLYRARYVVQRRTNPSDPSGDAVICGIMYLDQSLRVLGNLVPVRSYPALITANGRQESEALIARSAGLGAAFQAPTSARFMVPVVALYGPDALTDIEVLGVEDVTSAFVLAPPIADFEARLAALESANLSARMQILESEAGTPGKLTFGSKGDAAYATIPDSVQVVELLGRRYAGDGGGGRYVRTSAQVPDGADSFTCHGAVFLRETVAADVVAGMLESGFEAWAGALPKDPPVQAGKRWLNNGSPTITLTDAP